MDMHSMKFKTPLEFVNDGVKLSHIPLPSLPAKIVLKTSCRCKKAFYGVIPRDPDVIPCEPRLGTDYITRHNQRSSVISETPNAHPAAVA